MAARTLLLTVAVLTGSACLAQAQINWGDINAMVGNAMAMAGSATNQGLAQANAAYANAMAQANTAVSNAQAQVKQAVAGLASSGVSRNHCGVLNSASGSTCTNGNCCSVDQKLAACNGALEASATINGRYSMCCVALVNNKGQHALMCAGAPKKGVYAQMPSSAKVQMQPSCAGGKGGSLQCKVELASIPPGWKLPTKSTWNDAYYAKMPAGFSPCGNGAYKMHKQIAQGSNRVTVQCL